MVGATLPGLSGRKDDAIPERGNCPHEGVGILRIEMFGDLETDDQIVLPIGHQWLPQIELHDLFPINLRRRNGMAAAFVTHDLHTAIFELAQVYSRSAANIHDRIGGEHIEQRLYNPSGRG